MALNNDLISQFAKITKENKSSTADFTMFGTVVEYEGAKYVQIDGSDVLTPISPTIGTTTNIKNGERVIVMLKNHTATITGNLSSPAASNSDVSEIGSKVDAFETAFADRIVAAEANILQAFITKLEAGDVKIDGVLYADDAIIKELVANDLVVTGKFEAVDGDIETLYADTVIIRDVLMADKASVDDLQADFAEIETAMIEKLSTKYANIDFANIDKTTMWEFYAKSGIVDNIVVGDSTITGKLVGVIISGDLIEANTIKAESLVVRGEDGLYYKLNVKLDENGEEIIPEGVDEEDLRNGLHGSNIIAKTITATQISVKDLVAFKATIGGLIIADNAIYSTVKKTVDNTTSGIYMDNEGQMAVGDETNYIKFYKDTDENYKLDMSASTITIGGSDKTVEETIDSNSFQINEAKLNIDALQSSIASLVTGQNGESLMTQTDSGWTFSIANVLNTLESAMSNIDDLNGDVNAANHAIDTLNKSVEDIGVYSEYIKFGTENGKPCIILGETDSNFKVVITNTDIRFVEGSIVPASITNQSLNIGTAVVTEELRQGGFAWVSRPNGNYGLVWKGV